MTDDASFAGSIPEMYERLLVPILFDAYARDMARRVERAGPDRLLEIAAGTGAATRRLAEATPPSTAITATDLSPEMLERAKASGTSRPVEWLTADAMDLPFDDGAFDMVVSQFGLMFAPDKTRAFSEIRRVLAPGGAAIVSVWDTIEKNGLSDAADAVLARTFPDDPPTFLRDGAFGYHDAATISRDIAPAGFDHPIKMEGRAEVSVASSADAAAAALCKGGPVSTEVEARRPGAIEDVTAAVAQEMRDRYGEGEIRAPMHALIITART